MSTFNKITPNKHGIVAKKSLGQHFLINQNVINTIVSKIEPFSHILEIGPGTGSLTKAILKNTNTLELVAIEKDISLIPLLEEVTSFAQDKTTIIHADAMDFDMSSLHGLFRSQDTNKKIIVLSNLPYNIGTLILMNLLDNINLFSKIIVMLQNEVVDRIIAKPKTKSYGRVSVICQSLCSVKKIATLSPNSFRPKPKVVSAIVELTPLSIIPSLQIMKIMHEFCRIGFGSRRKFLLTSLKNSNMKNMYHFLVNKIEHNKRIEEISVTEMLSLATAFSVLYEKEKE